MRMSISIIGRLGVVGNASLADVSRLASVSVVSRRFDSSSVRDFCSQWFVNSYGREPVRVRRSKWMSRHRLGSVLSIRFFSYVPVWALGPSGSDSRLIRYCTLFYSEIIPVGPFPPIREELAGTVKQMNVSHSLFRLFLIR